jgi:hypothetical protein
VLRGDPSCWPRAPGPHVVPTARPSGSEHKPQGRAAALRGFNGGGLHVALPPRGRLRLPVFDCCVSPQARCFCSARSIANPVVRKCYVPGAGQMCPRAPGRVTSYSGHSHTKPRTVRQSSRRARSILVSTRVLGTAAGWLLDGSALIIPQRRTAATRRAPP